jgi:hypothetical protein
VKDILLEKTSSYLSDASFYDNDDDFLESDSQHSSLEKRFSVGLIEAGSMMDLSSFYHDQRSSSTSDAHRLASGSATRLENPNIMTSIANFIFNK